MGLRPRVRPRQGVILPRLSRHPFSVAISLTRAVAEAAIIPSPITASRTRLRPRACSGFGRLSRGTAHMVLLAYWNA